ncbi:hypothetical protein [Vogesella urethralis]
MPTPQPPVVLVTPCRPIPPLASDDWDAIGRAYIQLVLDYGECAAKVAR